MSQQAAEGQTPERVVSFQVRAEDLLIFHDGKLNARHNIRRLFAELIGVSLQDQDLSQILWGLRGSMVDRSELQLAAEAVHKSVAALQVVVDQFKRENA